MLKGWLKKMNEGVSVVICVRNEENYVKECLNSILRQSFFEFELIIIDDQSSDNTANIIGAFNDKRIKYFRNEKRLGISGSRNKGLKNASGVYIFFTDGDCTISKNWVEEGLKYFQDNSCIAVEGAIYYVSRDYEPTFSDYVMENKSGGKFMTGSMAYKKNVLQAVGGFDEELHYFEDRDIAFKIMRLGKICFSPKMIAYHPRVTQTPKKFIESASHSQYRVRLFKRYGDKECMAGRIAFPLDLVKIICPPVVFASLFHNKFQGSDDYKLVPFTYIYAISERLQLWKRCIKERIFLI